MTNLKVIIRVRPLSQREIDAGTIPVIEIQNRNTVAITNIKVPEANTGDSRQRVRRFTFDCCFQEDATQDDIFARVEEVVSRAIKRRYHSCVLAYGQSSTGKTHTMMGFPHDPGLTPRLSQKIFGYLQETAVGNEIDNMKTTVSYLEIYNEKVRDLLAPDPENQKSFRTLRVREHPKRGPYVQGLTEHRVSDPEELLDWIRRGNENRRVASTLSNPLSSRSHSVVTITCDGVRLYLVDLAGSERAGSRFCTTSRFREGANINRSLVALGNVISALAEQPIRKTNRRRFVPYRDSVLTWLLKDTLGGNSKTVMIATVSPSSSCYSESVNTLRFGQRAKLIVSCPVVNEDPKEKIIRELRTEVAKLRELLKEVQISPTNYMIEKNQPLHETKSIPSFIPCDKTDSTTCSIISDKSSPFQSQQENSIENVKGKIESEETSPKQISVEKLISVMDVKTSVSSDKKQLPKFRRTASEYLVMERSRTSSFGSHESLPTTKPPSVGSKTTPKSSILHKTLTGNTKTLSSSNPAIRRRSMDKSSTLKTLLEKRTIPKTPTRLEKSVETDITKLQVKSKVDSHRKIVPKPRSDIVANVTRRLYLKAKNKDVATDVEGIDEVQNEVPKELSICSNARLRLKEITQKALRAHRYKQVETQTETVVLRVKEVSTDISDLRHSIPEVKDVETSTIQNDTVDASVGCSLVMENFNSTISTTNMMKITKSCAVQCCEELLPAQNENMEIPPKREPSPSRVSFTKYLQSRNAILQPSVECLNPSISNPIYANSVNINVSHHYVNGKRVNSLSDDSLEDHSSNNMLFPTPDLISNHNSLDPNVHATQNEQPRELKTQYALENFENELLALNHQEFESETPEEKIAKVYNLANLQEKLTCIELPQCAFLPEVCYTEKFQTCPPLYTTPPNFAKATVIDCKDPIYFETYTLYEPTVLKSCVKISTPHTEDQSEETTKLYHSFPDFQQVPDSLEYHKINRTKHVRFSPQKTKNQDSMFKAMSSFLEEATILMNNITQTSKNIETSKDTRPVVEDFDLQISIDDVSKLETIFQSKIDRIKNQKLSHISSSETKSVEYRQSSSQTSTETASNFTQYEDFSIPVNKFDSVLEKTCKKLEYRLNSYTNKRINRKFENTSDITPYPSLNSVNPSFSGFTDANEDFSLESYEVSHSDYGSLNRKSGALRRKPTCSPSALLKQLTHMRKQVIESSREDSQNTNS